LLTFVNKNESVCEAGIFMRFQRVENHTPFGAMALLLGIGSGHENEPPRTARTESGLAAF
jgi:hypothetical protein